MMKDDFYEYKTATKRCRMRMFLEYVLPWLSEGTIMAVLETKGEIIIEGTGDGTISLYPISRKVHIHKGNVWRDDFMYYIENNLVS